MLRRVDLLGTDVLEERIASIVRATRIGELGTTLAVTRIPSFVDAKQPLGKYIAATMNTRNNRVVGRICVWVVISRNRF
jgi:hypothetical protein